MILMIKIDVSKNSKNTVIAMLSSAIELDSCAEIWIKEKGEAIKTNERKLKQKYWRCFKKDWNSVPFAWISLYTGCS